MISTLAVTSADYLVREQDIMQYKTLEMEFMEIYELSTDSQPAFLTRVLCLQADCPGGTV